MREHFGVQGYYARIKGGTTPVGRTDLMGEYDSFMKSYAKIKGAATPLRQIQPANRYFETHKKTKSLVFLWSLRLLKIFR